MLQASIGAGRVIADGLDSQATESRTGCLQLPAKHNEVCTAAAAAQQLTSEI
jgi:hypothetical protein